ncbi:MAG: methyltransferase domain-containing protein [Nitrincola lacisaponensis]|uniref:methyltransferase domain-containing protein n=1 Tax=Nitrincola lacisaponensis TaxID=267850 RepID=UPI00391CFEE6
MIEQYKKIHSEKPDYGNLSVLDKNYDYIKSILSFLKPKNFIDFGCGKGVLADTLSKDFSIHSFKYDPAIPKFANTPTGEFDVLINTDVLEHIPETDLDSVINHMRSLSSIAIIVVHLALSQEILPNGENAHCTIKSPSEWKVLLSNYYSNVSNIIHHHPKRTIFVCSHQHLDLTPCLETLKYIRLWKETVQSYPSKAEIAQYSEKFSVRLSQATMLLLGKKIYMKHRTFFRKYIVHRKLIS